MISTNADWEHENLDLLADLNARDEADLPWALRLRDATRHPDWIVPGALIKAGRRRAWARVIVTDVKPLPDGTDDLVHVYPLKRGFVPPTEPDLIAVELRHNRIVGVRFDDGLEAVIDLGPHLWGPVFEPILENEAVFRQLYIDEAGALAWPPGDAGIDPEYLRHLAVEAHRVGQHRLSEERRREVRERTRDDHIWRLP